LAGRDQSLEHRQVEPVALVGPVQADVRHTGLPIHQDSLFAHAREASTKATRGQSAAILAKPPPMVSAIFDPARWERVEGFDFTDITYHRAVDQGTVRIAFHRPEVRNAFRPHTVDELFLALDHARQWSDVGCVILTGNGPSPKDGGWA